MTIEFFRDEVTYDLAVVRVPKYGALFKVHTVIGVDFPRKTTRNKVLVLCPIFILSYLTSDVIR
jgi:hypothetical protein